jgi:hypothetical protein
LTLSRDFQAEDHRGLQPVWKPVGADERRGVAAWPGLLIELGGGCAICMDPGRPFRALWTLWRCRRGRCQLWLWETVCGVSALASGLGWLSSGRLEQAPSSKLSKEAAARCEVRESP